MSGGAVTWQLVRVETGRLARSPYPWVAAAGSLAVVSWLGSGEAPNLAAATLRAAASTFVVAATVLVLANVATLRDQRPGVPEMLAALPSRAEVRTRAVLVAATTVAGGLAALVIGAHVGLRAMQGMAAAQVDALEVVAGVAAAALLAAAGVALGRWLPSPATAPVFLVVMGTVMLLGGAVLVPWHLPVTVPYEFQAFGRPTLPRVGFLAGLLVLVAAVALLRHGRQPLRVGVAALGIVSVAFSGGAVFVEAPAMWSRVAPDAERTWEPERACVDRGGVTYCHYPGFDDWVPLWAQAADPVRSALPPGARADLPTIVQQHRRRLVQREPGQVFVGTTWGSGDAQAQSRAELAGGLAAEVTGLAADARAGADGLPWRAGCDGRGQARTVVALWLAGRAAPLAQLAGAGRTSPLANVAYGEEELAAAEAWLAHESAESLIGEHWQRLLDPQTGVPTAHELLALPDGAVDDRATGGQPQGERCR